MGFESISPTQGATKNMWVWSPYPQLKGPQRFCGFGVTQCLGSFNLWIVGWVGGWRGWGAKTVTAREWSENQHGEKIRRGPRVFFGVPVLNKGENQKWPKYFLPFSLLLFSGVNCFLLSGRVIVLLLSARAIFFLTDGVHTTTHPTCKCSDANDACDKMMDSMNRCKSLYGWCFGGCKL